MKIRIMGTIPELDLAKSYYQELEKEIYVKSVVISRYYPNRGSNTVFRLYVEIEYRDIPDTKQLITK